MSGRPPCPAKRSGPAPPVPAPVPEGTRDKPYTRPSRFAEDHPIEMLRGAPRPGRKSVLRALARRAAWLSNKIEAFPDRARDLRASYLVEELTAIGIAIEAIEVLLPPKTP